MNNDILAAIDKEIASLQEAKKLLTGTPDVLTTEPAKRRGRPKGSTNKTVLIATRTLSAAGKARIAAAQKARWAKARKAA